MENTSDVKALYIIVNAGFSEQAVEIARKYGAGGGTVFSARGTGTREHYDDMLAFEPEKEIIVSLVSETVANNIMDAIKAQVGVDTLGNGICFALPVDRVTTINKK